MKQLRILSLSDIRKMLSANQSAESKLYLSKGVGIALGINNVFKNLTLIREPFVVEDPRFILVTSGSIRINVNLIDYELRHGIIGYVGCGSIVQFVDEEEPEGYNGMGIMMNNDRLRVALHGDIPLSLNGTEASFFVETTEEDQLVIRNIVSALWMVVHQEGKHEETVNALIAALAYVVNDIRIKNEGNANNNRSHERDIFDRFIALVNKHSAQEHHLPFYADKLCISEKYLSAIIRQASGTTAKEWLDRSLITAAKVKLRHSDLQISQIADQLNFPNASFFCKYFKRITGVTPLQYRNIR